MPRNSATLVRQIFDELIVGKEPKDIAEELNISIPTVYNVKNEKNVAYILDRFDFAKCYADILRIGDELAEAPSVKKGIKYMLAVNTADMAEHLKGVTGKNLIYTADKITQLLQTLLLETQLDDLGSVGKGIRLLGAPDENDLTRKQGKAPDEITKS